MMKEQTVQIPKLLRAAPVVAASIDEPNRSVKIAWATDRPVLRSGFWLGIPGVEQFWEVLSMNPAHIRLERFIKGLSVLDSHNWASCDSVVGVATNPEFPEGGQESHCKVRFSAHQPKADRVFKDVVDEILRHWSFGYDVHMYMRTGEETDGIPVFLAVDWEPTEVSVVPVPADPDAGLRADNVLRHPCHISMRSENMGGDEQGEKTAKINEGGDPARNDGDKGAPGGDNGAKPDAKGERALPPANTEERARIAAAERVRGREIRAAAKVFGVSDEEIETFIESERSADDIRRELVTRAQEKQVTITPFSRVEVGEESQEKKRSLMSRAILHRIDPTRYPLRGEKNDKGERDPALEFRGMTLVDMARHCLESSGFRTAGYTHEEIARLAMGNWVRDKHTTTDFPLILSGSITNVLRDAYQQASQTYQIFCRRASVRDFRERNLLQIGDVTKFKEVVEAGEYKRGTLGEGRESYRVKKYGQIIGITLEAIVNDDMDAFSRIPISSANEAAQTCGDIVYEILLSNPKMSDGKALFHADHGNLGTAADIDLGGMDEAFTAIGTQKNLAKRALNLTPEFLIFGHKKRTKALQYLNDTVVPTKPDDVTPSQMRGLTPVVEARIPDTRWFLACRPGIIDTIEYAFLEGHDGIYTEERWGFEVDGLEIKTRLVFGAKAIDYRGLYMNPGV